LFPGPFPLAKPGKREKALGMVLEKDDDLLGPTFKLRHTVCSKTPSSVSNLINHQLVVPLWSHLKPLESFETFGVSEYCSCNTV